MKEKLYRILGGIFGTKSLHNSKLQILSSQTA